MVGLATRIDQPSASFLGKPGDRQRWIAVLGTTAFVAAVSGNAFSQQVNPFVVPAKAHLAAPVVESPPKDIAKTIPAASRLPGPSGPSRLPTGPTHLPSTNTPHSQPQEALIERLPEPKPSSDEVPHGPIAQYVTVAPAAQSSRFEPMQVLPQPWLPSVTPSTQYSEGRRLLDRAHHEYTVSAYASAEASAWNALRKLAAAVDTSTGCVTASENLEIAETAMREARDFAGKSTPADAATIERLIRCHQTAVLKPTHAKPAGEVHVTATEAIDRYMNEARVRLSHIASQSVDAAEAMDLIGSISLGRYQSETLPNETALTLRRAALQGQPRNGMLASMLGRHLAQLGLLDESRWALEHALSIQPDVDTQRTLVGVLQRSGKIDEARERQLAMQQPSGNPSPSSPRIPEVIQLTPEQFAAVSQPVMLQNADRSITPTPQPSIAQPSSTPPQAKPSFSLASTRVATPSEATIQSPPTPGATLIEPPSSAKPSFFRSLMQRVGGMK